MMLRHSPVSVIFVFWIKDAFAKPIIGQLCSKLHFSFTLINGTLYCLFYYCGELLLENILH